VQPKKKGISIAPIIALVAAALVLILVGALAVLWIIKRRQIQSNSLVHCIDKRNQKFYM